MANRFRVSPKVYTAPRAFECIIVLPALVVVVAALALLHIAADRFAFLDVISRSRWLSLAGGVSVVYVLVRLLPELAAGKEVVHRELPGALALFTVTTGFQFLITDFGLKEDHCGEFRRTGRWGLAGPSAR